MCGPGESPWPGPRGAQTGQKPFRKRSGGGGAPGWRAETSLRPTPPPRFAFIYPGGFNRAAIATGLFPQDAARGSREASGRWARGEPSAAPGERRLRLPGLCFRGRRRGGGGPRLVAVGISGRWASPGGRRRPPRRAPTR